MANRIHHWNPEKGFYGRTVHQKIAPRDLHFGVGSHKISSYFFCNNIFFLVSLRMEDNFYNSLTFSSRSKDWSFELDPSIWSLFVQLLWNYMPRTTSCVHTEIIRTITPQIQACIPPKRFWKFLFWQTSEVSLALELDVNPWHGDGLMISFRLS